MRPLLIVGNWKMNKTASETATFLRAVSSRIPVSSRVEFVVAPPFTSLESARATLGLSSPLQLGAQNVFWEDHGAYTGEIAPPMLKEFGCRYVILGHSERRRLLGERDEWIEKKIRAALAHDLRPIVCIGESAKEREEGQTKTVVYRQLSACVGNLSPQDMEAIVLAYEPIWAIGTGKAATIEQAADTHQAIRQFIADRWSPHIASAIRILYGGSVAPDNIGGFLQSQQIDGALIGGACLHVESFVTIATIAHSLAEQK
ncbi:MAG: triose-phosphate isomerase [Nitrospira sp.]